MSVADVSSRSPPGPLLLPKPLLLSLGCRLLAVCLPAGCPVALMLVALAAAHDGRRRHRPIFSRPHTSAGSLRLAPSLAAARTLAASRHLRRLGRRALEHSGACNSGGPARLGYFCRSGPICGLSCHAGPRIAATPRSLPGRRRLLVGLQHCLSYRTGSSPDHGLCVTRGQASMRCQ